MATPVFHPCAFGFHTSNIRRTGNTLDGGSSISGISDEVETTGGGYWLADFSNGQTRDSRTGKAWLAMSDLDAGEKVIVLGCSRRRYQPVRGIVRVPWAKHDPFAPFVEQSPSAAYVAGADAVLRATSLFITGDSEIALTGGELMSILHPNWGWRWYNVRSVTPGDGGFHLDFRSPLREAVTSGTTLEFDVPRCQMVKASQTDNTVTDGRYTACAISFREDMVLPVTA